MKRECSYTQGMLRRFLKGYLFRPQQKRVERHLASCPVCRSQHDALRRTDETREILRYLDAKEGIADQVKAGLACMARLFFRPLWLALIVVSTLAIQMYVLAPLLHDPDLEKLDAVAPPPAAAMRETAPLTASTPTPVRAASPVPEPAPVVQRTDHFVITIAVEKEHEKAGMAVLNEAMKEHALLTNLRFSEKVRTVSGSLTPDELYTFFSRVRDAGKITYKRSRLASAPAGEPLPFVMKLQIMAPSPQQPIVPPAGKPDERPAAKPVDSSAAVPESRPENVPAAQAPQAPQ